MYLVFVCCFGFVGIINFSLVGCVFIVDFGFLLPVTDDLGFLLWLIEGVVYANGDGVAQVEQPGRVKSMMYVCGIDL